MFWSLLLCFAQPTDNVCVRLPVGSAEECNSALYTVRRFAEVKGIKEYEAYCIHPSQYT